MWEYHITDSSVVEMTTTGSCGSRCGNATSLTAVLLKWLQQAVVGVPHYWQFEMTATGSCGSTTSLTVVLLNVQCLKWERDLKNPSSFETCELSRHLLQLLLSVLLSMFVWRAVIVQRIFRALWATPMLENCCVTTVPSAGRDNHFNMNATKCERHA